MGFDVNGIKGIAGYDPSLHCLTDKEKENLSRLKQPCSIEFIPTRDNTKYLSTIVAKSLMMEKLESMFQSISISEEETRKMMEAFIASGYSIGVLSECIRLYERSRIKKEKEALLAFVDETPPTPTPDILCEDEPNRFSKRHRNEKWKDSRYKRPRSNEKKYF